MRKLFFCFLIAFTIIYTSTSVWALPNWVLPELKKYPPETFLFNVGRSDGTAEEAFKKATTEAHRKVAARILRTVAYIIRFNEDRLEHDMVREHYSAVLEDYCTLRQASPALQLEGFSVRNLSVDLARTDLYTYALVYIKRDKLKEIYANHVEKLRREIKLRLETAKALEEALEIKSAVKTYLRTYPLYESLKEAEIIQIGAEYAPYYSDAFKQLADAATYTSDDFWTHRQVIKRVEELEQDIIVNFDDIFDVIGSQISQQTDPSSRNVSVRPLIYEDSEMICPFAREFGIRLHEKFGWVLVDAAHDFKQTSPDISKINPDFPRRFSPTCWENGDEITIRATLRDVKTGKFLASAVVRFLNSQMRNPLTCQPGNYKQALIEKDAFDPRYYVRPRANESTDTPIPSGLVERLFSPIGGLKVEVWTDKGKRSGVLSYVEGETMKLFGRVNQPAYIRLLYVLPDEKRTLLQNNYYIDSSRVNSDVEIGEFVCTPPFGAEMLIVAARTEEFPPIDTYKKDGYKFLADQDAESAARSFSDAGRGMQLKSESNGKTGFQQEIVQEAPDFQQSEAQLVITTMEK